MISGTWDAMIRDAEARGLTDNIAIAHDLFELAERMTVEADAWTGDGMHRTRRALHHSAQVLEACARQTLRGTDPRVGETFRDTAHRQLKDTIAKRRRLEELRRRRANLNAALEVRS